MLEQLSFNHGELVFREGEESDFAYLIVEGKVEIFKRTERGTVLLGTLGAGELFGEMGLVSHAPRSASAAADGPVVVKQISREAIDYLLGQSPPEVSQMLRSLMERLQEGNRKISRLINKQSQFQLATGEPPVIKRVSFIPLSSVLKEQFGKGMAIELPFRLGAADAMGGDSLNMNNLTIQNADPAILSANHLCIQRSSQGIQVVDRGSVSGTIVNDIPIGSMHGADSVELTPGDNMIVAGDGSSPYRFCVSWESE